MMVTDQIAALRALGTPVRKLVIPRVVAGIDGAGADDHQRRRRHFGASIISSVQLQVAGSVYWNNVIAGLFLKDIWMGLIKPFVLGFVLVTIGCHVGLRTKGGRKASAARRRNAVVAGSVMVLAVDFLVTSC
jgi:phospholipid/cholesterol/gamma-HCH transport system permease protein